MSCGAGSRAYNASIDKKGLQSTLLVGSLLVVLYLFLLPFTSLLGLTPASCSDTECSVSFTFFERGRVSSFLFGGGPVLPLVWM